MMIKVTAQYKPYGLDHPGNGSVSFIHLHTQHKDYEYSFDVSPSKMTKSQKQGMAYFISLNQLENIQLGVEAGEKYIIEASADGQPVEFETALELAGLKEETQWTI